jgi:hypothetical protein
MIDARSQGYYTHGRPFIATLLEQSNCFFVDMPRQQKVQLTILMDICFAMRRFLATFFVFLLFFNLLSGISSARELTLDFADYPSEVADLFRAKFPELQREFKTLGAGWAELLIYHEATNDEYKATLIMPLEPSTFGVDERRVIRTKLDLRPFAAYFLALDSYRGEVKKSSGDPDVRAFISRMPMSIILMNVKGDRFEFYGETDFFMGVREAIISPNFTFTRGGKKPITVYMEPTAVVSQVFILPPARDENKKPTAASLIYDFFSFQY